LIQLNEPPSAVHENATIIFGEKDTMEIRTIVVAVSGGSASFGAVDLACRLARRFGSHLEAFHVQLDPREIAVAAADPLGASATGLMMEQVMKDAAENRMRARGIFDDAVKRHGLPVCDRAPPPGSDPMLLHQASAGWHEQEGYSAPAVASRARLFDLLVLGRSGRVIDEPHGDAVEEALLTGGRPVLIAPADAPKVLGETIAIAWNDSPECAKALAAAMPFLTNAREVYVLSIGRPGAADLVRHLAWYGIRASAVPVVPVKGVGTGELMLAAARDYQADLLVMGGYGHAPWRELLFGGVTREVVGTSLLPLLLAH
jgi:nucleotide-binding universal stress UspA family protein